MKEKSTGLKPHWALVPQERAQRFAGWLHVQRRLARLSVRECADAFGISRDEWDYLESGDPEERFYLPDQEGVNNIATILKVAPHKALAAAGYLDDIEPDPKVEQIITFYKEQVPLHRQELFLALLTQDAISRVEHIINGEAKWAILDRSSI